MKGKKSTYLLFALVVVVWGAIAYRIFNHVYGTDADNTVPMLIKSDSTFSMVDTNYTLKLNYSDPFLKGSYVATNTAKPKQEENIPGTNLRRRLKQNNTPQKAPVIWPEIVFNGIILNDKTNEELGLVTIGGSSYLLREGEIRSEVNLLSLYSDSIRVVFQEETKTIKK